MNSKQKRTLTAIFEKPTRANIDWKDIESLLVGLGSDLAEGNGSRLRVALNGIRAVFHRPHPRNQVGKLMVESVRRFLKAAGVEPNGDEK